MICQLDIEKARNLRGIIERNKYAYKYNIYTYAEVCTAMDRLEDTVGFLSSYDLPISNSEYNAFDFIAWVNYGDLIINCLKTINTIFVIPGGTTFFHDNDIKMCGFAKARQKKHLTAYYNTKNGDDDSYFRYLRSIVLAHSLKSDCTEFKKYHNGSEYAYTPLVRWESSRKEVNITYYAPDPQTYKMNTNSIVINVEDLFKYIQDRYSYLDKMYDYIKTKKSVHKEEIRKSFQDMLSNVSGTLIEKTQIIKDIYINLGDIDIKNNADNILCYLKELEKVLGFSYSIGNETLIQLFDEIAEIVLEDLVIALKEQDFSKVLLLEIFGYTTYDGQKIFSSVYSANKISEDYENLLCFDNDYRFKEEYKKIEKDLLKHCDISRCTDNMELVLLTKILICLDNVRQNTDKKWGDLPRKTNNFLEA